MLAADTPAISPADHSYRYGDGLFETMKVAGGEIRLADLHFDRLFSGLKILKIQPSVFFTPEKIAGEIVALCKKNNCEKKSRVRLSISRGSGGLYDCDNHFSYLIECWPLSPAIDDWNENGLVIDIYPDARKPIDQFSNLKSANYLPYVMAAIWAKENKLNEALVLNAANRICDATTANLFWVKDREIFTPNLGEGCVAGVMRKHILDFKLRIANFGFQLKDAACDEGDILTADEVFLTNSIYGIRWVKQCGTKTYSNKVTSEIYSELFQTNK